MIKDGDLYKRVTVFGRTFELRYGYYVEYERSSGEPIPIYPDFTLTPEYTKNGYPFVTQMQALCPHGKSKFSDGCCVDCKYYHHGDDLIGICTCEKNRLSGRRLVALYSETLRDRDLFFDAHSNEKTTEEAI